MRRWTPLLLLAVGCSSVPWAEGETSWHIAYLAVADDGYWQVFEARSDGIERQVTTSPGDKTRASWFPDGSALLVSSMDGPVVRADLASGEEKEVPIGLEGTTDASLSPDGEWIAFSVSPAYSRDDHDIFLARSSGGDVRRLASDAGVQHEPVWSPDGEWVYFLSGDGERDHDIFRVSPSGDRIEQLTAGQAFHFDVAVGPGGTFAYSNNATGNYELWLRRSGEEPQRLTSSPAADGGPAFVGNGSDLVFTSTRGGESGLWAISIRDGVKRPLGLRTPARAPVSLLDVEASVP